MRLWWVILLMVMQIWRPHQGAQERFLSTPAFEALFGGAAGPGKTDCLLMEALRQIDHPRYNGILFRRTFPMLDAADGLIARAKRWYPQFGAAYNESKHIWTFPSGAHIYFGHLQYEADLEDYQSAQYQYIGFDELTQFTERMYLYMFSRCRADVGTGLRCYIRGATNPGGIGHLWVKARFVTAGIVNRLGHFARIDDHDTQVDKTHPDALSRTFIPAKHQDNPVTSAQYAVRLRQLDPVERARLEDGDWDAEYRDGIYDNWSVQNVSSDKTLYQPDLPLYWAVDDGYRNPRAILFIQVLPDGTVAVIDEYYKAGQLFDATLDEVLAYPYPRPQLAIHDPAAAEFAAQMRSRGIAIRPANNNVAEGIKAVRSAICDAQGVVGLLVNPKCANTIRELPAYAWDKSNAAAGGDPKPLKVDDHTCDALRYFLNTPRYAQVIGFAEAAPAPGEPLEDYEVALHL